MPIGYVLLAMMFFFTTLDSDDQVRESCFGEVELEVGLGILDDIIALGHRLVNLTILEAGRLSTIPMNEVETAYLPTLRRLQSAWQQLLTNPVKISVLYSQRLLELRTRRIRRHQICIAHLEGIVHQAERRLQYAFATILRQPHRRRMLHQLEATLKRHQQTLITEQASLQRFLG
ncbi:hypothetical protein SAMN05216167_13814 [Spirosoma endophyticum]|uniref:Uncharacterized protein n=1 Tax=Spirosoma endophyticum TaxID=662367 RepID=A0A1I2H649_9BACT|nr:hypothetical protein SAMN05216167_13814 [Spirosoma endophyticum]